MPHPARKLRAWRDDAFGRPPGSAREMDREDRIINEARLLLYKGGRRDLTLSGLALALRMSAATIKMAFCDLDNILFEILRRHLLDVSAAVAAVPAEAPNRQHAQADAYLKLARAGMGGLSQAHHLLIQERLGLPPDLAEQIETIRIGIGSMIAPAAPELALNMLDTPYVEPARITAGLATIRAWDDAAEPIAPPADFGAEPLEPTRPAGAGCSFLINGPSYTDQLTDYKPPPSFTGKAKHHHATAGPVLKRAAGKSA